MLIPFRWINRKNFWNKSYETTLIGILDKFLYFLCKENISNLSALSKGIWCSDPQKMNLARRNVENKADNSDQVELTQIEETKG